MMYLVGGRDLKLILEYERSWLRQGCIRHRISCSSRDFFICQVCFQNINGITKRQTERLCHLKFTGQSPKDKRGLAESVNKMLDVKRLINEHIKSYDVQECHYYENSRAKKFSLDKHLNLEQLYLNFWATHRELGNKVSLSYYRNVFRKEYEICFGKPQVDTCCSCESFDIKLKDPALKEERAALLIQKAVHRKKWHFAKIRKIRGRSNEEEDVVGLSIDYMSKLDLPRVPVQEAYYPSKLTVNIFPIKNFKTDENHLYVYDETTSNKRLNEVCSFVASYLVSLATSIKHVFLFSDGCPTQNRNSTFTRMMCVCYPQDS